MWASLVRLRLTSGPSQVSLPIKTQNWHCTAITSLRSLLRSTILIPYSSSGPRPNGVQRVMSRRFKQGSAKSPEKSGDVAGLGTAAKVCELKSGIWTFLVVAKVASIFRMPLFMKAVLTSPPGHEADRSVYRFPKKRRQLSVQRVAPRNQRSQFPIESRDY
jgi:hypothetical protein